MNPDFSHPSNFPYLRPPGINVGYSAPPMFYCSDPLMGTLSTHKQMAQTPAAIQMQMQMTQPWWSFSTSNLQPPFPPPTTTAPTQAPQQVKTREEASTSISNQALDPIYVNPKQHHRILVRRQQRAQLQAQAKLPQTRKPYLHESRHIAALNRRRESGRFAKKEESPGVDAPTHNEEPNISTNTASEAS